MGTVIIQGRRTKVRHLSQRKGRWFFVPSRHMKDAGFHGEPLGNDMIRAAARAQEINRQWDAIRSNAPAAPEVITGSLKWLCDQYRKSSWYQDLGRRTVETYDMALRAIEGSPLAKRKVSAITRGDVRRIMDRIRETRSDEYLRKVVKVLRRVLTYGVELELITTNPAAKLGVKANKPRRQVWKPEHVNAFVSAAIDAGHPGWALAVMLAYDTTQRLSDLLGAQHRHFDGEGLNVEQGKTGKHVWCPLYPDTIALYQRIERRAITIVYGATGRPITNRTYFNRVFRKIAFVAEIPADLQFRDLRRTGISEVLAGGGRGEPISGHAQGSQAVRVYEVPDKAAARSSMAARVKGRE